MRIIAGDLVQESGDAEATVLRSTGALREAFQRLEILRVVVSIDALIATYWTLPSAINIEVSGESSGVIMDWGVVSVGAGGVLMTTYEYVPVADMPPMYDENVSITLSSISTGQSNQASYTIYYNIVKGDEMEMVQAFEVTHQVLEG